MENIRSNQSKSDIESFEKLFKSILDDTIIKDKMIKILSMDSYPRHIVLSNWLEELRRNNASQKLIHALSYLFDDVIAQKILRVINRVKK
jgi:hypothetical protein